MALPGLSSPATPPAVRRPRASVSFGAAGAGGLLGAVSSALGAGGPDPWQAALSRVSVVSALAPAVDVAHLHLAGARAPQVALEDAGSIALGYADESPSTVLTGAVTALRRDLAGGLRVTVGNAASRLARLRLDQPYEGRSAGQIVADLAQRAGVATGNVADGVELAYYVVDSRRNAYEHVAELARRSGLIAFVTAQDELTLCPPAAAATTFHYGTDLLALEVSEGAAPSGEVRVVGEGAAGSQGAAAWAWLAKDPGAVTASAGSGDPLRLVQDGALRSRAAAQQCADGRAAAAGRARLRGRILAPGTPGLLAGTVFEVSGCPGSGLDGRYLARAVRHDYSVEHGFVTRVTFSAAQGNGAGALGGLL